MVWPRSKFQDLCIKIDAREKQCAHNDFNIWPDFSSVLMSMPCPLSSALQETCPDRHSLLEINTSPGLSSQYPRYRKISARETFLCTDKDKLGLHWISSKESEVPPFKHRNSNFVLTDQFWSSTRIMLDHRRLCARCFWQTMVRE